MIIEREDTWHRDFRLPFSKQGFTSQERVVTVSDRGGAAVDVALDPE